MHDAAASGKFFSLNQQRNLDVLTYAENITVPGQSRFPRYPVVIAATETPWTACALYRDWALQQQWTRKGKLADRTDIPADAGDIELWFNMAGAPDVVGRQFATEIAAGAGKTAIHWYCWNLHPFDTHYPDFFPALPGFAENVAAMQAKGHYVVPYINGRLWDVSLPDFAANGSAGATMRADGSTTIEDYGSGATLAAMCPTSKAYQQKIMDAFTVFVEEYQIKGVYIDQIGAAAPVLCYNPEHGHPLGGGGWWQEAYREMLEPIVKRYGDRVLIATENGAEPYMDTISSFLLWMAVFPDDFPSLPAVYNQYAWHFCSPVTADDNRNEFCALLSRCRLWGIQPGWLPWLHDGQENTPEKEWKKSYIATMTALRRHAAKTLIHGVLVDEVSFVNPVGTIPVEFKRNAQYGGTSTPGKNVDLTGAIWRSADGESLAIALAELSGNEREVEFEFAPERYGVSAAGKKLYRLHADGMLELVHDGALPVKFTMAPHDLQVYLWQAPAARQ